MKGRRKKETQGKIQLQQFIIKRIWGIIAAVFFLIFLALNLFFRVNIIMGAREQLGKLVEDMARMAEMDPPSDGEAGAETAEGEDVWLFTMSGERVLKGNVFIISKEMELFSMGRKQQRMRSCPA